jgi:hypothetical protein
MQRQALDREEPVGRRHCHGRDLCSGSMTVGPEPHLETDRRRQWVGGVVTLPTCIADGGKTYRPSLIIWLDVATEMILGAATPAAPMRAGRRRLRSTAPGGCDRYQVSWKRSSRCGRLHRIDAAQAALCVAARTDKHPTCCTTVIVTGPINGRDVQDTPDAVMAPTVAIGVYDS